MAEHCHTVVVADVEVVHWTVLDERREEWEAEHLVASSVGAVVLSADFVVELEIDVAGPDSPDFAASEVETSVD